MSGIWRLIYFLIKKGQINVIFAHFHYFGTKTGNPSSYKIFGFYILPGKRELWSLPLVNYP